MNTLDKKLMRPLRLALGLTLALVASLAFIGEARAQSCTLPYTFQNGVIADATQVNANFSLLNTCLAPLANPTFTGTVTTPALTLSSTGGAKFQAGNQAGTSPWLTTLYEQTAGDISTIFAAGWGGNTSSFFSISAEISAANDPTSISAGNPRAGLAVLVSNTGSAGAAVGVMPMTWCKTAAAECFGINPIAFGYPGAFAYKLVGAEIDHEFGVGNSAAAGSAGFYINTFNVANAGPAIQTGAVNGSFSNGISLGGLSSTAFGLATTSGASNIAGYIATTNAGCGNACILLGNNTGAGVGTNQIVAFQDTSAILPASIGLDASNLWLFKNNAATNGAVQFQVNGTGGSFSITGMGTVAAGTGKRFVCIDPATKILSEGTGATCV